MNDSEILDVIILGAGYGGLGMGAQLRRHGIDRFLVLERADRIGGVWRDNDYPGAACDTQSHIYCYSFFLNLGVSRMYAGRDELLDYLDRLVDEFGLTPHIRLNSEIVKAEWQEDASCWRLEIANGEVYRSRVFVPAWGQLGVPNIPAIPGLETFNGVAFHSARWRHDVDLVGKRVASIGAAASAVQYLPEIAPVVARLTVFQRSANYILPRGQIVFSPEQISAFLDDPSLFVKSRTRIHEDRESAHVRLLRDSGAQQEGVDMALAHLQAQVPDAGLRAALTPDYEYGCKRILRSDDYYPALMRDNVELVTGRIERILPNGVQTGDGRVRELDVIIFGTGFRSQAFQGSAAVIGRSGVPLSDRWGHEDAEAYLGIVVDGFPNMFLVYGPNTNINHNSIVTMMEAQQRYILEAVEYLRARPNATLEIDASIVEDFNVDLQAQLSNSTFSSECSSWYKNSAGKVVNNWPSTVDAYWKQTAELRLHDYLGS